MVSPRPAARFTVEVPPEMLEAMAAGGAIEPRISRAEALQCMAVLRGRNLVCTPATLPLRKIGPDRRAAEWPLFEQPDPDIPTSVIFSQVYEDLLFEGIAWWRVTAFGWHGFPVQARHVPVQAVHVAPTGGLQSQSQISPDQLFPVDGQVFIDGVSVPDREIIRFDSPNPPLLLHAARAIRTCLKLDRAAALYATDPLPLGYFSPAEGADSLSAEPRSAGDGTDRSEVDVALDAWEAARSRRAWGYVGGLEAKTLSWNPEQLQLADQRQHAVLEIARAIGVDPEDLGVSTTSRTYQNGEERRQDKITDTYGPYVSAVQDRLSMRDVTPRGYKARVDFGGFLRGDTLTRMTTYKTGLEVGAYTDDEIRELENRPALTPAQRARVDQRGDRQAQPPARPNGREPTMSGSNGHKLGQPAGLAFEADGDGVTRIRFDTAEVAETFRVNVEKRTISGLAVPWGKVARSGFAKWRFAEGSLRWSTEARVKLNLHHDFREVVGHAMRLQSTSRGLDTTFKVGEGPEEDRALRKARDGSWDGFSIEVDFDDEMGDQWQPDPSDESVRLVRQATLRGVALTGMPAFDDARVTAVKATRDGGKGAMPEKTEPAAPAAQFDMDGYVTKLGESMAEGHKKLTADLAKSLGDSFSAGIKAALENIHDPQTDGPQPVRAARFVVTREAPIYTFNGGGSCLVRDAWAAHFHRDDEAYGRIRKFHQQTEEMSKIAHSRLAFATNQLLSFGPTTTTSAAEVIPPGYRPDLFVPQLAQGRPFVNALSRGVIQNSTPFVVPIFGSATGATADHVEGTPPSDGTLAFATKTVTPTAISGLLKLTREIVDSSNPVIDQIALNAMRESYARQSESKVYTLLNGSSGQGGTITAGFVPSGAQVRTTTGGSAAAGTFGGLELLRGVRAALAVYSFRRFGAPDRALLSQEATSAFATAEDAQDRPLLPSVGAQNAAGVGNAVQVGWFVDGLAHVPAWAITGNAAGDADVFTLNSMDAWAWESPTLVFRYEERSGPTFIDLALFGYFATHLLRPVGLSAIRHTVGA
jgi:HK97 family phage prohead protease